MPPTVLYTYVVLSFVLLIFLLFHFHTEFARISYHIIKIAIVCSIYRRRLVYKFFYHKYIMLRTKKAIILMVNTITCCLFYQPFYNFRCYYYILKIMAVILAEESSCFESLLKKAFSFTGGNGVLLSIV